jgi:hypothetical protein
MSGKRSPKTSLPQGTGNRYRRQDVPLIPLSNLQGYQNYVG